MLHRFANFLAGCTVLLLLAGSLVTSTGSGLSVPDWPTSYGWSMFTFPPSKWVGGIFYEHTHRLIASTVGILTVGLAIWLWRQESRRWVRRLGIAALGAIVAQGVLGGITVLFYLPAAVSTGHAALAEIFFCMIVGIALFTSPGWNRASPVATDDRLLRRLATATTALIFVQIFIGATMRHTGAGLSIPDFPLMFGHLVPLRWDARIAIHFAHRAGALVVAIFILLTATRVWRDHPAADLRRPAALLVVLVVAQITLGALTVLSRRDVAINSAHVVCGALVLATSLVVTLRSWRTHFSIGTPEDAGASHRLVQRRASPDGQRIRARANA